MRAYHTPLDLVRSSELEVPAICTRPDLLARASQWFQDRFPGEILYAVKANPSPWVIDGLYASGLRWFDVASMAEIEMVASRCPQAKLAFLHPIKSRVAIRRAYHDYGVRVFAIDCAEELQKIVEETGGARDLTLIVRLAVSNDHSVLPLTGKFGVSAHEAPTLIRQARAVADELGVCFHVGSQCMQPDAFRQAMDLSSRLIAQAGVTIDIIDVGGGFPSLYPGLTPPPLQVYLDTITQAFENMLVLENATLWCEPGRALVADAESVLVRIDLRKEDALYLNDGAFGTLFDAAHSDWPFPMRALHADGTLATGNTVPFRLYGPTCDSEDVLAGRFDLPATLKTGDYIEIGLIGAYGTALTTRFNGCGQYDYVCVSDTPFASAFGLEERPATVTPLHANGPGPSGAR